MGGEVFLVEHALVEARRQADVVDVPPLQMDAAAQLATRRGGVLANQGLQEVRGVDRDGATQTGQVEVRTDVAPEVRQAERTGTGEVRERPLLGVRRPGPFGPGH